MPDWEREANLAMVRGNDLGLGKLKARSKTLKEGNGDRQMMLEVRPEGMWPIYIQYK